MIKHLTKILFLTVLGAVVIGSCQKDEEEDLTIEDKKKFAGSENCQACHAEKYDDWIASGHPYKFSVVENGNPPEFPTESQNFMDTWMANLGDGSHNWDDIAGVIGGYGWKTRFVGNDGLIVGSADSEYSAGFGHNQFNFFGGEDHGWVDYKSDVNDKAYDYSCFKCHTTGPTEKGSWLDGVDNLGDFAEQGIGCESCHGPGSQHIDDPSKANIDRVYEFAHTDNAAGGLTANGMTQTPNEASNDVNFMCGTCHNRGYDSKIDASGGFIKHHEQWDEMKSGPHANAGMDCSTCHDPHKRVIWDGDGIIKNCSECHDEAASTVNHPSTANCVDCHMPYAAKSGTTVGNSGYEGDIRSHLMRISVDTATIFTADGSAVIDNDENPAALNVAFSCLGCHNRDANDHIPDKTLEEALDGAANMHMEKAMAGIFGDTQDDD